MRGATSPCARAGSYSALLAVGDRRLVCVVLSAEQENCRMDPEQTLLSPIFDDGNRMIYEFRRAHIVRIDKRGALEMRFVAIDPMRGIVGTKTVYRFDTRLIGLASRCVEHLTGEIDLFPMRDRPATGPEPIPEGEANLSFASSRRRGPTAPRTGE